MNVTNGFQVTSLRGWAFIGVALGLLLAAVACAGEPRLRALDLEIDDRGPGVEYTASYVDGDGERMADVNVMVEPLPYRRDGELTKVSVQLAHAEGTTLDSLEVFFRTGFQDFTPVYLEASGGGWLPEMTFEQVDGGTALVAPDLGDSGQGTVTREFLLGLDAFEDGPVPLRVTFDLDGAERTAMFNLEPARETAATQVEFLVEAKGRREAHPP